jgi:uncharacterized caspase-like protein
MEFAHELARSGNAAVRRCARFILFQCIVIAAFVIWHPSTAFPIESKYLFQKPPKRIAMVVGNSDYKHFDPLPGSIADAHKITAILSSLGFKVTEVKDVKTLADFQTFNLKPFLDTIEEGAFVVFYFSGHGFTYDNDSYLVPTLFPKQLTGPVYSQAIPAKSVLSTIAGRNAALSIMILDACRSTFDIKSYVRPEDRQYVDKGFPPTSAASNQIISYASDLGKTAAGSTTNKVSTYTASLANFIGDLDSEWSDVKKNVTIEVRQNTSQMQNPWFSESNTSYVWFNASPKISKQIEEAWQSALKRSTVNAIDRFAEMYAVSPYAAAAREWLAQNANRTVSHITQVSPVAADAQFSAAGAVTASAQLTGPLAFDRSVAVNNLPSDQTTALLKSASIADILTEAGQVVLLAKTAGRLAPSESAKAIKVYGFGSKLRVLGSDNTGSWLKVYDPNLQTQLYIQIPATVRTRPLDLGDPIQETFLSPRASDVPGLVDEKQLQDGLKEIRDSGWKITWVSIATPHGQSAAQNRLFESMANNALLILTNSGLPRGKITTVAGLDIEDTAIRLRFFGTRASNERKNAN